MSATATNINWSELGMKRHSLAIRWMPCLTDLTFLLPIFLACCLRPGPSFLLSDGDTGWHIRTGDWILQHRAVPRTDLFSFTKSGQPWFAWEWGSDIGMSLLHRACGLAGLTFVTLTLLCVISALLFRLVRRYSGSDFLALALTVVAICGSMLHWLARPHLISWLLLLIFSHLILSAERGDIKALRWLPVLSGLWANLHGGFFIGIILLLTTAAGIGVREIFAAQPSWTRLIPAWRFIRTAFWCALATLVNPYGWNLHKHIWSYLRDSKLLDNITEFQSISFHHPGAIFFELSLLFGLATVTWCAAHRRFGDCISTLLWAHMALLSGRNIPIFLLIATPFIACMLADAFERTRTLALFSKLADEIGSIAEEFRSLERVERCYALSGFALLVIGLLFSSHATRFDSHFEKENFPLTAIPSLQKAGASRIFTYDQWGDYLIYRFYPRQKVFVDGRSDFFGTDLVTTYQHIVSARYDCETQLQRFGIDTVLIKPDEALATVLKRSGHWNLIFDDGKAAIFRQKDLALKFNSQERRSA